MAEPTKSCPKCGGQMVLHQRPKPQKSSLMFMDENHWVCTNADCKKVLVEAA